MGEKKGLRETLMAIQQNLNCPKAQQNTFGKYAYRSQEDILEAVKPLLGEHRCTLVLIDSIYEVAERVYVGAEAILTDVDTGDTISSKASAREPLERKGMDASQITGATSSYARKYALNGLFGIDDNKDPDHTNNGSDDKPEKPEGGWGGGGNPPESKAPPKAPPKPKATTEAQELYKGIAEQFKGLTEAGTSKADMGAMLSEATGGKWKSLTKLNADMVACKLDSAGLGAIVKALMSAELGKIGE